MLRDCYHVENMNLDRNVTPNVVSDDVVVPSLMAMHAEVPSMHRESVIAPIDPNLSAIENLRKMTLSLELMQSRNYTFNTLP